MSIRPSSAAAWIRNSPWNFKPIVRLDRINAYNMVNESRGFRRLTIVTPLEVTRAIYEEDSQDI